MHLAFLKQSMIRRSVIASASPILLRSLKRIYFTSGSRLLDQQEEDLQSDLRTGSGIKGKETEKLQISIPNLYEHSRAASRPRANATSALYSGALVVKGNKGSRPQRSRTQDIADVKIAHFENIVGEKDARLRRLYKQLEDQGNVMDIFDILELCRSVKTRLQAISVERGRMKRAPTFLYLLLLEKLSSMGAFDFAIRIANDMEDAGYPNNVISLNILLKAAVVGGDDENVTSILERIYQLQSTDVQIQAKPFLDDSEESCFLSPDWTRNWNSTTYQHLLYRCRLSHNLEYALALIASASQRGQEDVDGNSFLTSVLSQSAVANLVAIVQHAREARLAVELVQWLDNGIAVRRINAKTWMTVLHLCADQLYHPGIVIAWEKAIVQGLLTPDEGTVIAALTAASRAGDASFIETLLDFYQSRLKTTHGPLREWHLIPLFQAQCYRKDYISAFRTATKIARSSSVGLRSDKLVAIKSITSLNSRELDRAYDAFMEVGRDSSPEGGVCLALLNNLLQCAQSLDRFDMILKLYRSRNLVRNENSPSDTELPLPKPLLRGEDERDLLIEEDEKASLDIDPPAVKAKQTLISDINTFNELFHTALKQKDIKMSEIIRRQLNKAGVKGNERTYELATRIELLKDDYENVFSLLEECKKRQLVPTGWMYSHIAKRCVQEDDRRWIEIGKQMLDNQYPLPKELLPLMIRGGHYIPAYND